MEVSWYIHLTLNPLFEGSNPSLTLARIYSTLGTLQPGFKWIPDVPERYMYPPVMTGVNNIGAPGAPMRYVHALYIGYKKPSLALITIGGGRVSFKVRGRHEQHKALSGEKEHLRRKGLWHNYTFFDIGAYPYTVITLSGINVFCVPFFRWSKILLQNYTLQFGVMVCPFICEWEKRASKRIG